MPPQHLGHITPNGNGRSAQRLVLQGRDEHDVREDPRGQPPERFTQDTASAISDVGLALPFAHRIPDAQTMTCLLQKQQPHQISLNAKTGAEDAVELPPFFQGYAMVRHLRPLRLLLRRILRPEGEEERARKPIFLLRGFLCG